MADTADVEWKTCGVDGCIGFRPDNRDGCLVHDQRCLAAALQQLGEHGHIDARGVMINRDLLGRILSSAPQKANRPVLKDPKFDRATFEGDVEFLWVRFQGTAQFTKARFQGSLLFLDAIFEGEAQFLDATFEGGAWFQRAHFENGAEFEEAAFQSGAWFGEAHFGGVAQFGLAAFHGYAQFHNVVFYGEAKFHGATFEDGGFQGAIFHDGAWFLRTVFERARQLGPMLIRQHFSLDQAVFKERVQIEVAAARWSCKRTRFLAGAQLGARWAKLELDDADLAGPSILTGAPPFEMYGKPAFPYEHEFLASSPDGLGGPPRPQGQPWVASLRRADVAGLAISNVDLQACYFTDTHNLDRLRLESPKAFSATPGLKVATGWAWPPVWWWTRRQTLAEEHHWRADHERGIRQAGWHAGETWAATTSHWVANPPRPATAWRIGAAWARDERARRRQATRMRQQQAREVAALYRALRKAREDVKDEPDAADFYYGEMEMRRHATPRFSVERAVLALYWLVAGYGLRGSRALAALAAVLVLAAWLLAYRHGFVAPQTMTFWGALRYSGRTAIGLLPKDQPTLTPFGDLLQITVRVVVPVLLGLAVLSIRGRIKR